MPDVFDAFNKLGNLHCTASWEPQSVACQEGDKLTVMLLVLPAVCLFGFRAGHISKT